MYSIIFNNNQTFEISHYSRFTETSGNEMHSIATIIFENDNDYNILTEFLNEEFVIQSFQIKKANTILYSLNNTNGKFLTLNEELTDKDTIQLSATILFTNNNE